MLRITPSQAGCVDVACSAELGATLSRQGVVGAGLTPAPLSFFLSLVCLLSGQISEGSVHRGSQGSLLLWVTHVCTLDGAWHSWGGQPSVRAQRWWCLEKGRLPTVFQMPEV